MIDTSDWPNALYNAESSDCSGKAELCRGDAIVVQEFDEAAVLLVRVYVPQTGQALHLTQQDRPPFGKILHVV